MPKEKNTGNEKNLPTREIPTILAKMIRIVINDELIRGMTRKQIIEAIAKTHPELKESQIVRLFRQAKIEYYTNLKRINPDTLLNQINEESEELKNKVLEESNEDITKQVAVINKVNETLLKANRVYETAPRVNLIIETNINEEELINNDIIEVKTEKETDRLITLEDQLNEDQRREND